MHQVLGAQMRVSLQHLEFPMARDGADLRDVETQIVKMKVRHSGAHSQVFECQAHGITGQETLLLFDAPDAKLLQRLDRRDNGTSWLSLFLVKDK